MPNSSIKAGDRFKSSNFGYFVVKKYVSCTEVIIQFEDTKTRITTNSSSIKIGAVRDPYAKVVAGVGYTGIGAFSATKTRKVYALWLSMLQRVYYVKSPSYPHYKHCRVVKSWHCLQTFGAWVVKQPNWQSSGFELDKDLRISGNSVYGPKYCSFVPSVINTYMTRIKNSEGVRTYPDSKRFYASGMVKGSRENVGFDTKEEAHSYYLTSVAKYLKTLLRKYKKKLHKDVVMTLKATIREMA